MLYQRNLPLKYSHILTFVCFPLPSSFFPHAPHLPFTFHSHFLPPTLTSICFETQALPLLGFSSHHEPEQADER